METSSINITSTLKPLDLSHGNHKMMYEPPNRGSKTYQALNNTPTGTNDPAALTDPAVLANSFPVDPRLYDRVERLGKQSEPDDERDGDGIVAYCARPGQRNAHRPGLIRPPRGRASSLSIRLIRRQCCARRGPIWTRGQPTASSRRIRRFLSSGTAPSFRRRPKQAWDFRIFRA
jgi:hypothetical protein